MPLADEAASKLLVKEGPDGTVKFDNPAVGDFQVLDALVEVSVNYIFYVGSTAVVVRVYLWLMRQTTWTLGSPSARAETCREGVHLKTLRKKIIHQYVRPVDVTLV